MIATVAQCSMRFDYYDMRGKTLQQLGRHEAAVEAMEDAAAYEPPSDAAAAELFTNLGVSYSQLGTAAGAEDQAQAYFSKSIRHFQTATGYDPQSFLSHYGLANLLVKLRRHDEAEVHYRQALAINPEFSDAYANLAGVLEFTGRLDEAIENYRRALDIEPDAADLQQLLTIALQKRKQAGHGQESPHP